MSQKNTDFIEDKSLKRLKIVVKSMGVMLVVGTIALVVAVIFKASNSKDVQHSKKHEQLPQDCIEGDIKIPLEGNVLSADSKGNRLTIVADTLNAGQQVLIIDTCRGEVIRRVEFGGE